MKNSELLTSLNKVIKETYDVDLKQAYNNTYPLNAYEALCAKVFCSIAVDNNVPVKEIANFLGISKNTVWYHSSTRFIAGKEVIKFIKSYRGFRYELSKTKNKEKEKTIKKL